MNESIEIAPEVFDQAADWVIRIRARGADAEVHAEWLRWVEAHPAHRAAFAEIQETWSVIGELDSPPWPKPEELSAQQPDSSKRRGALWALAASLAVAIAAVVTLGEFAPQWIGHSSFPQERIMTRRGEQQSAVLPDGSRIELGGATAVALDFTPSRRLVVADEGEVFYKVQRDAKRPFVVRSGPISITAVGTAFSVRREGGSVSVVVTEGIVEVKSNADSSADPGSAQPAVRAHAGERVRFDHGQLVPFAQPVQTTAAAAWRRGQLRFEEEPLRVVVASLNRYSPKQIVLADAALGELRFTGTVFDDSADDWLRAIERVFPVTVDDSQTDQVVIARRP